MYIIIIIIHFTKNHMLHFWGLNSVALITTEVLSAFTEFS